MTPDELDFYIKRFGLQRREKSFRADGNTYVGIPEYDALRDKHLQEYLSRLIQSEYDRRVRRAKWADRLRKELVRARSVTPARVPTHCEARVRPPHPPGLAPLPTDLASVLPPAMYPFAPLFTAWAGPTSAQGPAVAPPSAPFVGPYPPPPPP
eukprot:RCo031440